MTTPKIGRTRKAKARKLAETHGFALGTPAEGCPACGDIMYADGDDLLYCLNNRCENYAGDEPQSVNGFTNRI